MNENLFLHILATFIISTIAVASLAFDRHNDAKIGEYSSDNRHTIAPIVCCLLFLLMIPIVPQRAGFILYLYYNMLLSLLLLTNLLLALTPLLRKHISAQGCAELWILPGYVSFFSVFIWRYPIDPLLVVRLPKSTLWLLFWIWIGGIFAVMVWKIAAHLQFRRALLRSTVKAPDHSWRVFHEVWDRLAPAYDKKGRELPSHSVASHLRILCSPAISSPLTIGLFKRTACLVLPEREYSDEELRWIFRHESIHLLRSDNFMKFTITFLCAAGWFIPTLWIGMKKASEDLELCCDELATAGFQQAARQEYANLLLQGGGTEKGFTTCLSASAKGIRYRLRYILHPVLRKKGSAVICLLLCVFLFCIGIFGLKADAGTLQSELADLNGGSWRVTAIEGQTCKDPEAVANALRDLKLTEPYWNHQGRTIVSTVTVTLELADGRTLDLYFTADSINARDFGANGASRQYLIEEPFDLNWLRSMAKAAKGG